MNYQATFGILVVFFLWVLVATMWWQQRLKRLKNEFAEEMKTK